MLSTHRPRIVCATLYDEGFASVGWMGRNTLTQYGRRHGHDVIVARSVECDRAPAWYKVRLVQALLDQGYDYVFWMDADALFLDTSRDVAGLIQEEKDLHLVQHSIPWFNGPVPNTGVFLIRNCEWSRDLLQRMWGLEQYADATWWENAAFMHLLGLETFRDKGIYNPNGCEIDTSRIDWLPECWNRTEVRTEPGRTLIRHYAGRSKKHRLRNMTLRLNWPKAIHNELTRRPQPLDLSGYGVSGGTIEFAARSSTACSTDQAERPTRAAA